MYQQLVNHSFKLRTLTHTINITSLIHNEYYIPHSLTCTTLLDVLLFIIINTSKLFLKNVIFIILTHTYSGPYGSDYSDLKFDLYFETSSRIHIKVTDLQQQRWQVPSWIIKSKTPNVEPSQKDYTVNLKTYPFGFEVMRTATMETLFNTSNIPLVVSVCLFVFFYSSHHFHTHLFTLLYAHTLSLQPFLMCNSCHIHTRVQLLLMIHSHL